MAEKGKKAGSNDPEKKEESSEKIESAEKLEEKVEEKIESSPDPKKAVNIIGDIKKPDPADKDAVLDYFKKIDAKLDQLLNPKKSKEPKEEKEPLPEPGTMPKHEEKPWYDREFI